MKRLFFVWALCLSSVLAFADEFSGPCGQNATWQLDQNSATITISGSGDMTDYTSVTPWHYRRWEIQHVVISNGITSIGANAFRGCENLLTVTMPNSVTKIGDMAFAYCDNLTNVTLSNSISDWGTSAFEGCMSLAVLSIPEGIQTLGDYTFYSCKNLAYVNLPNSLISFGSMCTFNGCENLISIIIGDNVSNINNRAFQRCGRLSSVTFGNSVDTIEAAAFAHCDSLHSLVLPNSLISIRPYAFSFCSSIDSIIIPNSVVEIANYAFRSCSNATVIRFGDNVSTISQKAFTNCTNVEHVYCNRIFPPSCSDDAFDNVPTNAVLHVPAVSISAYRNALGWRHFTNIVDINLPTSVSEATETVNSTQKIIENDKVFILKDGVKYDLNGKVVK